ncbi:hypothetical protein MIND_00652000 [Mycena indigotica]|uniref:Uncharacterized protein n=1 Tax=Mycena indigotica TaxID=2126181 RepID=A0A8H6W3F3_9AGAR|nr:uncharacterized protein MIND_00652000 [Mycena indigotica]KAF7304199.1 hypothetical protein MIND_00652000 [Mycena indigotica]
MLPPGATPASTVFAVPELCDLVAPFLSASIWDLRTSSLISRPFTQAAQRLLFRDVILNRGTFDIDHVSSMANDDEASKSARLAEVLKNSTAIAGYIRRIRLAFEEAVLRPLEAVDLPNLRAVVFHRRKGGAITQKSISLGAALLALPNVQHVGLIYPIFHSAADATSLLAQHTSKLSSIAVVYGNVVDKETPPPAAARRVTVRKLYLEDNPHHNDVNWMFHAQSPLDLVSVEDLSFGKTINATTRRCLQMTRAKLTNLALDAQHAVNPAFLYDDVAIPDVLSHYPRLKHLVITSTGSALQDAAMLLKELPTAVKLESLTIVFDPGLTPKHSDEGLSALGLLLSQNENGWADPKRCVLKIVVPKMRREKVRAKVLEVFGGYDAVGHLSFE